MMISVIASLLAGLGLFFVGLHFLTEHLKILSGRRLRERIALLTKHPLQGVFWGGILIAVTQSTAATTFILIGMLRSGMMKVHQTLPIIIGINMLGGIIVLVLVFDVRIGVFFVLGLTGFLYTNYKARGLRPIAGAAFGIGMLFLGLNTMQTGVAPLTSAPWFEGALQWTKDSYVLGFLVGATLSFVVQSSLAVVVLTIALQQAGLFSLSEAIMIVYGANAGSSFLTLVLSSSLSGQSKQIAMFQTAYNFLGVLLLIPIFYLEIYAGVPLVKAATEFMSGYGGTQIAIVNLIFNAVPGVMLFIMMAPGVRLLQRFWPESIEEQVSKPKYLHDHATNDPDTALKLIELEQTRLIEILSNAFGTMREGAHWSQLNAYHEAFKTLSAIIRDAISDLSGRQLSTDAYERLDRVLNLQYSLETASDEINNLGGKLQNLRTTVSGARFAKVAVEGVDAILLMLIDVARERKIQHASLLDAITSEDGIGRVRRAYLAEESELEKEGRWQLLSASNHCERLIWLFGELGRTYMSLSEVQK
jgi:phosphate:Na+ symporter